MTSRKWLTMLFTLLAGVLAACGGQTLGPLVQPGANPSNPDVGGISAPVGSASTTEREPSPRLDATTQAMATFPTTVSLPVVITPSPALRPATPTLFLTPTPGATPSATSEPSDVLPAATQTLTPEPAPTETPAEIIHVVAPGENLYQIGLQYGLNWVLIAEYNAILNPDQIEAGLELRIPPTPMPTPPSED